jgi:NodT family efflux transporter outer membrane factor (OMF) lipoprotein
VLSGILLSGCAIIPDLGLADGPKLVDVYTAQEALRAPAGDWPAERWWAGYGDEQLTRLIDEALSSAPSLAEAEARVRQAHSVAQQTGAALLPALSAQTSLAEAKQSYNNGVQAGALPHGWNETASAGLNFSYEFDFWGKNKAALASATSAEKAARADAAAARLALSTAVASAYADLAQLYADQDAAEDALRVRTRTQELMAERLGQGLEHDGAVKQAEANRAAAQAQLAAIDESIGLAKNAIAALVGAGPDCGLAIAPPQPVTKAYGLPANLKADLVGRRPDVVASRLRAEAAAQRIKVAKADFYPNVNLSAALGVQSLGLDMLTRAGSDFGSVGPAISLPIFSGGRISGAYREARAEYDASVAAYDDTLVRALKDVADVATSERALASRLSTSRDALAASEQAYDIAENRYRGGLSTYLDVLTAEDVLIANRRAVADLKTRSFSLDVALVRALGGGYQASHAPAEENGHV